MQYGSMSSILRVLEERSAQQNKELLATAQQEADVLFDKLHKEGLDRLDQRKVRFQEDQRRKKDLTQARILMEQRMILHRAKQEFVEKALEDAQKTIASEDEEAFLASVCSCLEKEGLAHMIKAKAVSPENRDCPGNDMAIHDSLPTLRVPLTMAESAKKHFSLPVQADEKIRSGFLLDFDGYNINRITEDLFQYHHREYTRLMMQLLFSGSEFI